MTHQNKKKAAHRKWSFASLLLLASALVAVGICVNLFIRSTYQENASPADTGHVAKNETVFKNYNVAYPIFHDEKADVMMRNYVTHQVEDFLQRVDKKSNDSDNELTVNYTIVHYDTHTLTIVFHKTEQLSGKPEMRSQNVITYDLKKQTQLQLADIFKDKTTAGTLLKRILHDHFQHLGSESFTAAELEQLSNIKFEDVREFALNDDAIVLYVNPHRPISEKSDTTISIKKDLLLVALDDAFAASSPSLTQETAKQPTYIIDTMPRHDISTDPSVKMLSLTFDDGPGSLTPSLLDVLKKYGAHATFFVIGRQVAPNATIVRREVNEGNEVANHSWSHPNFTTLSYGGLRRQIGDTQQAIRDATGGYTPILMRPPEGVFNGVVSAYAQSQGLRIQLWSVDTLDWLNRDSQVVYNRIMSGAADGRVILLHDIYPTSISAATRAISQLIADGYQLVTVSELNKYRQ